MSECEDRGMNRKLLMRAAVRYLPCIIGAVAVALGLVALFGNFFGIHPVIISDKIGQNYAIRKIKGAKNVIPELTAEVKAAVIEPEMQTLYISHADNETQANALRDAILAEVPFNDSHIGYIGPIVGASVGPGTLSIYVVGKEVTVQGGAS